MNELRLRRGPVDEKAQTPEQVPGRSGVADECLPEGRKRGPVMAFDFGERRIGVAVGDREVGIAHPLDTVHYKAGQDPLDAIEALIAEWKPGLFVIGFPVSEDGKKHPLAASVQRFCQALQRRFNTAIRLVDERYTSAEASGMLRDAGIRGRKQKAYLDRVAAQTILEDFFSREGAKQHAEDAA